MRILAVIASMFLSYSAFATDVTTVKLYGEPSFEANPECDIHIELLLTTAENKAVMGAKKAEGSTCEIEIVYEPITWENLAVTEECGSKIYTGTVEYQGNPLEVTIQDNTARTCRDLRPAVWEVTMKGTDNGQPAEGKLYSAP